MLDINIYINMSSYNNDNLSTSSDEVVKLSPFNPKNKHVTVNEIVDIFKKGGVKQKPNTLKHYQEAFVHRSYVKKKIVSLSFGKKTSGPIEISDCPGDCLDLFQESNERLEFLGDSIVGSIVVSYLFRRFPDADEGFMTKLKTRLVKTEALANFAEYLELGKHMIISKHVEEKCGGRENQRMLEDLFESFIGGMFLDFSDVDTIESKKMGLLYGPGYSICETFIINIIETLIDFEDLILNDENYKDILLRHFQHTFGITPKYIEINTDGPAHKRHFTMGVLDSKGNIIGKGVEKSKKKAEQIASKMALIELGVITETEK